MTMMKEQLDKEYADAVKALNDAFAGKDAAKQKEALDESVKKLKALTLVAEKTNTQKEQEANLTALGTLIEQNKKHYNATTKTTYAEPMGIDGDLSGAWLETKAPDAGTGFGQWLKGLFTSAKDETKKLTASGDEVQKQKDKADKDKKDEKEQKGVFGDFPVGGTVGGIIGVLGGWFIGSMFGGGLIGKIAGVLLAVGGFFMGQKSLGGMIDGWLGRDGGKGKNKEHSLAKAPQKTADGKGNEQSLEPAPELKQEILRSYYAAQGITYNGDVQTASAAPVSYSTARQTANARQ